MSTLDRLGSPTITGPFRQNVYACASSNITLYGEKTIDGVACARGKRVLLIAQDMPSENGPWVVQAGAWIRPKDFQNEEDALEAMFVVQYGSLRGLYKITTNAPIYIGVTGLSVAPVSFTVDPPDGSVTASKLSATAITDKLGYYVAANVAAISALKAIDTTKATAAFVREPGREGMFVWRSGNYASLVAADTLEGLFVKANAVASSAGAWVRICEAVEPEYFGAAGDGVANDYPECLAAFTMAKLVKKTLLFNGASYLWDLSGVGTADWDPTISIAGVPRSITIRGNDIGSTRITITNATSIGWYLRHSSDWFDLCIQNLTITGSCAFPLVVIADNALTGPANMVRMDNVAFENTANNGSNVALRLNYIAGGTFTNVRCNSYALAVDNVLTAVAGTALELRQCQFVSFIGGSFGNASRSVDMKDGFNTNNTFTSCTLENCDYAISHRSSNSGAHTFISMQVTNVLVYEGYSSGSLSGRKIKVINPSCDGAFDVDPANYYGFSIEDDAAISTPAAPSSNTTVTNKTGRDVWVSYWGATTVTTITRDGVGDGVATTSGGFLLRAGKTCAITYTGTLTWRWYNAS